MSSVPFAARHNGPQAAEIAEMVSTIGCGSLVELIAEAVPHKIRLEKPLSLPAALSEEAALAKLRSTMGENKVVRSLIGMGFTDCITPPVIQRNILENPGWYTAYTPYQAEIAQGRLEALLNFQTMVCELTGMDVANASLLDEGTAAAEAVGIAYGMKPKGTKVFMADDCHPHVIDVVRTRCEPLGLAVETGDPAGVDFAASDGLIAVVVSYPTTFGEVCDYAPFFASAHAAGAITVACADPLALLLLSPPGEWGADVVVGNTQRFGVPLGFGGPHAAYMAVTDKLKRKLPGRLVGVSKDAHGNPGYRLTLQTREQHIRRDKATSNICTAQVLLAVMASMYAVYHGPDGLKTIAQRVYTLTARLRAGLAGAGFTVGGSTFFDTLLVGGIDAKSVLADAADAGFNLRGAGPARVGITLDERSTVAEVDALLDVFGAAAPDQPVIADGIPATLARNGEPMGQEVFQLYRTETEMLRYLHRLESRDIALNTSMIPLGSCTMKLNATTEMMPLSWPEVSSIHPFAPLEQAQGYIKMFGELESWLAEITGFAGVSLQPNAGSQGEYAGLLAIRNYHAGNGQGHRDVCLIPTSAHGTNPASAVMAGMRVIAVACDDEGNIDVAQLNAKAEEHADDLAALMVTYPSTHGVFEESIIEVCETIHAHGGQVYMDGANMNAQVGLTSPGRIGADVCHLNLHKTFCIPHGGGGPGVGPIGVAAHLIPFLPGHAALGSEGAVCSSPWGSASINTISWMYIAMMGAEGLLGATETAILNANYVAKQLSPVYPILYKGRGGRVAHECILDLRPFKPAGVEVEDVAKRLIDYGYHAPTMSWPVAGTLMVEPTESESKAELDRFCDAMLTIGQEIMDVASGVLDPDDNPLKHAPHTAVEVCADEWPHRYPRERAAFPVGRLREFKFWPPVGRVDNVYGDRNLICTCAPVEEVAES